MLKSAERARPVDEVDKKTNEEHKNEPSSLHTCVAPVPHLNGGNRGEISRFSVLKLSDLIFAQTG